MLKKLFIAAVLALALATGIGAGAGQPDSHGLSHVPTAHACPITDPDCGG